MKLSDITYYLGKNDAPRAIDSIIVHCAATPYGRPTSVKDIDRWHQERGWTGIGYHYVIQPDGTVEGGRHPNMVGAHTGGLNQRSLGVCLIGGLNAETHEPSNEYPQAQMDALGELLLALQAEYNIRNTAISGHNQHAAKACPCFRVPQWWGEWNEVRELHEEGLRDAQLHNAKVDAEKKRRARILAADLEAIKRDGEREEQKRKQDAADKKLLTDFAASLEAIKLEEEARREKEKAIRDAAMHSDREEARELQRQAQEETYNPRVPLSEDEVDVLIEGWPASRRFEMGDTVLLRAGNSEQLETAITILRGRFAVAPSLHLGIWLE